MNKVEMNLSGEPEVTISWLREKINAGELTADLLEKIKNKIIAPGWNVGMLIESNFDFENYRKDDQGRILPDYSKVPGRIELNPEEQDALRLKSLATGKGVGEIIRDSIRVGIGLENIEEGK